MIRFQLRSITAILFILLTLFGITNTFLTPSLAFPSSLSNTISYPIGNAFGMDHVGTDEAARAAQNGIHIARGDIYWNGAEQSLGVINVSNIQPYIQAIENESISPDITLDYGNTNLYGPNYAGYVAPSQIPEWLNYVNATIYAFQNESVYWEMWNEPNLSWTGPEEEFFSLMNRTANFIRDNYPNQIMISPGISGTDTAYLERMITYFGAVNFNNLFAAISFHPYTTNAEELLPRLQEMEQIVQQENYTGQLWITEFGVSIDSSIPGQLHYQANQLLKLYAQALSMNMSRVEWYCYDESGFGVEEFNSTTQEWELRPSGITYQLLSHLLTGGAFYPQAVSYSVAPGIDVDQIWSFPYLTEDNNWLLILWTTASALSVNLNFGSNLKSVGGSPLTITQLLYDENESITQSLNVDYQGDSIFQTNLSMEPVVLELNLTQYEQARGLPANTPLDQVPAIQVSIGYPIGYLLILILIPSMFAIGCVLIGYQIRRIRREKSKK